MKQSIVFNHNYVITTLVSRDDRLLVGDALTSVSLLRVQNLQIEPIAKDYGSLWPTCAELLDENTIVGGNVRTWSDFLQLKLIPTFRATTICLHSDCK